MGTYISEVWSPVGFRPYRLGAGVRTHIAMPEVQNFALLLIGEICLITGLLGQVLI
jgi:hypothetical protein